jgi:hypothetical protein
MYMVAICHQLYKPHSSLGALPFLTLTITMGIHLSDVLLVTSSQSYQEYVLSDYLWYE